MNETVLRNARIVLGDEVVHGSVMLADGVIRSVDAGSSAIGEDMEGDYLIPGLVELHTDHLEGHYSPRPKVRWNPIAAVMAHDAQMAASGVTTVFDTLRIGMDRDSEMTTPDMRLLADAIGDSSRQGMLRTDHYLHLRCEVSSPDCLESFWHFGEHEKVRMASLMDHAPGQRQFAKLEAYSIYYQGKLKMSDEEFRVFCERRIEESRDFAHKHREAISAACRHRGVILASHDDATTEHVDEAIAQGVRVAEFPTTVEAARASHEAGMAVLMGSPNLVRGGSHSGNVSARKLAEAGLLDILSSDYIPYSMLQAAFLLADVVKPISLPQAIATVTRNPARAAMLDDRGEISQGLRADLVRVRPFEHVPAVLSVWSRGRRVI
jgi:alpha-D-ribose 1-methylphosphonate 5-triphosphate diphosphatase